MWIVLFTGSDKCGFFRLLDLMYVVAILYVECSVFLALMYVDCSIYWL